MLSRDNCLGKSLSYWCTGKGYAILPSQVLSVPAADQSCGPLCPSRQHKTCGEGPTATQPGNSPGWEAEHEAVGLRQGVRVNDGVVGLGGRMHLGQHLLGKSLGNLESSRQRSGSVWRVVHLGHERRPWNKWLSVCRKSGAQGATETRRNASFGARVSCVELY